MKRAVSLLIGGVIAALALVGATTLYGLTMPREHLFLRRMALNQPPSAVWRVMTDYARQPEWHAAVVRAERLPHGAVGPLAGALAGAKGAARGLEQRSMGDAETQEALKGAGDAGPVYEHLEERRAEPEQKPMWRLAERDGSSLVMQVERAQAPIRLVRRFRDERGRWEGSWDVEIEARLGGSQVMLTERARIGNPLRRAVTRLLLGQDKRAQEYLRGLAASFGEPAQIQRVPREYAKPLE